MASSTDSSTLFTGLWKQIIYVNIIRVVVAGDHAGAEGVPGGASWGSDSLDLLMTAGFVKRVVLLILTLLRRSRL